MYTFLMKALILLYIRWWHDEPLVADNISSILCDHHLHSDHAVLILNFKTRAKIRPAQVLAKVTDTSGTSLLESPTRPPPHKTSQQRGPVTHQWHQQSGHRLHWSENGPRSLSFSEKYCRHEEQDTHRCYITRCYITRCYITIDILFTLQ